MSPTDIDKVLLVGGSTRIGLIRKKLEKKFGFAPDSTVNVDECVALGSALYAGLTLVRENPDSIPPGIATGLKEIDLTDVCNHSYGTLCAPLDEQTGERTVQNRIILRKNTPLPCESTQMFYTLNRGQSHLEVVITQGEDCDPGYVNKIASYKFELPPDRPEKCPVKVIYRYDMNQRMHCEFHDIESGRKLEVELHMDQNGRADPINMEKAERELQGYKIT